MEDDPAEGAGPAGKLRKYVRKKLARRARRREPTGFGLAMAETLASLNPAHWGEVTAGASVFLQPPFLETFREAGPPSLLHRYGLVYRGARPVAAFTAQLLEVRASQLLHADEPLDDEDRAALSLRSLTASALKRVRRRLMVCGSLATYGPHGVAFREGEDPAEIWPAIAEALYRIRRADRLHGPVDYILLKEIPEPEMAAARVLEDYSYRPLEVDPNMVLELDPAWGDLDGYLAALNKKYRKAARTTVKAVAAAGCEVAPLEDPGSRAARLHELYLAVSDRSQFRLLELPEAFFPTLAIALGPERFRVIGIHQGGTLIGHVTVVRDGDTAVGYYLGIDYEANAELPVYHRLLFAVIEQALAWGSKRISFGGTALDAKARLGCTPVPCHAWIRHRVPVVNVLVRRALAAIPHEEAPARNPFKTPPT